MRFFSIVHVFEYNKNGHAKHREIKLNREPLDDYCVIHNKEITKYEVKVDEKGEHLTIKYGGQYFYTHFNDALILVDKQPNNNDFSTIGILTGTGKFSMKHDRDVSELLKQYGVINNPTVPNTHSKLKRDTKYKVKRVLSRMKRKFQANILRQQVALSTTRTRTRNEKFPNKNTEQS